MNFERVLNLIYFQITSKVIEKYNAVWIQVHVIFKSFENVHCRKYMPLFQINANIRSCYLHQIIEKDMVGEASCKRIRQCITFTAATAMFWKFTIDKNHHKRYYFKYWIFFRVAVRILPPSSFCVNIRMLLGPEVLKTRHLEILGYKVIQIPHYEWNSMQLGEKKIKMEYLRNKIFSWQ